MPRLPPLPLSELPPALREAVDRGRASGLLSTTLPVQVWAHRPAVALAWLQALEQLHGHGLLPARLRELVRLKIASITHCVACQLARKTDAVTDADLADLADLACLSTDSGRFGPAERAALRYAELFAGDYTAIDDAVFADLGRHFTVAETVELNLFCALMLAGGRMTYVQQAYEAGADTATGGAADTANGIATATATATPADRTTDRTADGTGDRTTARTTGSPTP